MKNQPLLNLKNISWHPRANSTILNHLSLEIFPGEIIGLFGDNGAGKTSLMNIISGLTLATEGQIFYQGRPVVYQQQTGPMLAKQLGLAYVQQDFGLFDELSLYRNFFLQNEITQKLGPLNILHHKKMAEITLTALKDAGLNRALSPYQKVATLSGGEKQLLAIARAKFHRASLLMFDEPTSALSLRQKDTLYQTIAKLAKEQIAVIISSHDPTNLLPIIDRVWVLYQGKLILDMKKSQCSLNDIKQNIIRGCSNETSTTI